MTIDPTVRDWWLAESDRRDVEAARRLEAWLDGWRACEQEQGDAYQRGFHDGRMANKRAEHYVSDLFKLQAARYGADSIPVLYPDPLRDFPSLLAQGGGE